MKSGPDTLPHSLIQSQTEPWLLPHHLVASLDPLQPTKSASLQNNQKKPTWNSVRTCVLTSHPSPPSLALFPIFFFQVTIYCAKAYCAHITHFITVSLGRSGGSKGYFKSMPRAQHIPNRFNLHLFLLLLILILGLTQRGGGGLDST